MRTPATSIAPIDIRDPESYLARERAWRLDERRLSAADIELLRLGLGEDAVREAVVAVR